MRRTVPRDILEKWNSDGDYFYDSAFPTTFKDWRRCLNKDLVAIIIKCEINILNYISKDKIPFMEIFRQKSLKTSGKSAKITRQGRVSAPKTSHSLERAVS